MASATESTSEDWARKYRRARRLSVVLAVVVVFLAVVLFAQIAQNGGDAGPAPEEPDASASSAAIEVARNDPEDPLAIGAIDAPVVMVEWTDLRCPFCAVFSRDTLPVLVEEYVDEGLLRIEFHDVAFFGEQSELAAAAARAAGAQGRGPEYVETVFAAAPESGHPDLPRERLVAFAQQAGVPDIPAFENALDDPALLEAAQKSTATAQQLGVSSVPFFYAGGTVLSGAQPVEVFRDYIDAALAAAE